MLLFSFHSKIAWSSILHWFFIKCGWLKPMRRCWTKVVWGMSLLHYFHSNVFVDENLMFVEEHLFWINASIVLFFRNLLWLQMWCNVFPHTKNNLENEEWKKVRTYEWESRGEPRNFMLFNLFNLKLLQSSIVPSLGTLENLRCP